MSLDNRWKYRHISTIVDPSDVGGGGEVRVEYQHGYYAAAICRRGDVETATLERQKKVARRCTKCGAPVLTSCPRCGAEIRGAPWLRKDVPRPKVYEPPSFCSDCGALFPWASRGAIVTHLRDQLESDDDLDAAKREQLSKQLECLLEERKGKGENLQTAALQALRNMAPKAWDIAQPVLVTIATAEMKQKLGLPP